MSGILKGCTNLVISLVKLVVFTLMLGFIGLILTAFIIDAIPEYIATRNTLIMIAIYLIVLFVPFTWIHRKIESKMHKNVVGFFYIAAHIMFMSILAIVKFGIP